MCYLPLGCLKFIVGVGAILSIVTSLGLLALTIYANVEKKQIINNTGGQLVNDALVGLYLGSAVFMILGICGVYGAMKARKKQKNSGNCFLFLYLLGVVVFFAIFVAGTIFFFVGPHTIFGTDCQHGSKTNLIDDLYALSTRANNQFCANCPCYLNQTSNSSYLADWIRNNKADYNITTTNTSLKYFQSCLTPQQQKSPNVLLLGALQQLLGCGGWCKNDTQKYYKFYDINNCVTSDCLTKDKLGCHEAFQNFLTSKGQLMGFACSIATLLCLINIITVCCICYHPSKTSKGSNFYAKMMDQD